MLCFCLIFCQFQSVVAFKSVAYKTSVHGFRFSRPTADLLTVVSDKIARTFNRSGATQAVSLDISMAFVRVWNAGLLHKLKSYGISGLIFGLILSFHSNRRLWEVLHKNTQLMLEFLKAPFLVLHLSNYILMTFLVLSVGFLSIMMTLLSTLKCDQVFDQWQQLDIAAELESDLRDNVNLGSLSFIGITFLDVMIIWTGSIGSTSLFSREV